MAPPSYADLGKSARDLFNKGYTFGFLKLDAKTTSGKEVEFKTAASHNVATGKLFGNVEFKYKLPKYGMTMTEKWNTDNILGTEIVVEDKGVKGLKCTFDSSFSPQIGKRTGKVKADFKQDRVHVNTDVSIDASPIINGAVVGEYNGILLGVQGGLDAQRSKVTHTNFALGYSASNYSLHTFVNDGSEFGGNFYHKVNDKMEVGATLGWSSNESITRFGAAFKYQLEPDTVLRTKLSSDSQIACALTHSLSDHLKLTLSSLVNMQNFQEGGHKYGIGVEYEP
jgi:voltage-dependent anion channel protein 2